MHSLTNTKLPKFSKISNLRIEFLYRIGGISYLRYIMYLKEKIFYIQFVAFQQIHVAKGFVR